MFNAQVKLIDDKQVRYSVTVYTDTLYEAEIYLTCLLSKQYDSRLIWLQYEEDTMYSIYDFTRKIGSIEIFLAD